MPIQMVAVDALGVLAPDIKREVRREEGIAAFDRHARVEHVRMTT